MVRVSTEGLCQVETVLYSRHCFDLCLFLSNTSCLQNFQLDTRRRFPVPSNLTENIERLVLFVYLKNLCLFLKRLNSALNCVQVYVDKNLFLSQNFTLVKKTIYVPNQFKNIVAIEGDESEVPKDFFIGVEKENFIVVQILSNFKKIMDVEVLLKSEKILKEPAIILPETGSCVFSSKHCEEMMYQTYPKYFLKNILDNRIDNRARNGFDCCIIERPIVGTEKRVSEAYSERLNIPDYDQERGNTDKYIIETQVYDRNTSIDEENCSTSSCEIIESKPYENKTSRSKVPFQIKVSTPEKKYANSFGRYLFRSNDENYNSDGNYLSTTLPTAISTTYPTALTPSQFHPVNLSNYKTRDSVSKSLKIESYQYISNGVQSSTFIDNISSNSRIPSSTPRCELTTPNNKLIRPVPSLMPIENHFFLETDLKRHAKMSPNLIDLSIHKNVYFNRTYASAFDEVNNYPINLKSTNPKDSEHGSKFHNGLLRHQINYLQNQKSLRLGFSVLQKGTMRDRELITFSNESNYTNNESFERYPSDGVVRKSKKLPKNGVLLSPWSFKGPIYYRPERTRDVHLIAFQRKNEVSPTVIKYSSNDTFSSKLSSDDTTICQDVLYYRNNCDTLNDRNNNLDTEYVNRVSPAYNENHSLKKNEYFEEMPSYPVNSRREFENLRDIELNSEKTVVDVETIDLNKTDACEDYSHESLSPTIDSRFKDEWNPSSVKLEHSNLEIFKCEVCLKVFTSRDALAVHMSTHVGRARYKCDQCDKCFSQLRNYKYHVSVHKGTKEFAATCNVCGKYFNDRGYLSSHMKIHRNRKEYQCPHCPKSFNQRVAYNMHVRIHTGVKPHQCPECGKAFSRKMLLKQHARTHSGEKPYACSHCGKRFADRSNMTLHMRLHSGVKPFACTLCPKSFTKKHHLKTHLNYHTGNKPYSCVKCGLNFSQSSNMRTHMKKCSAPEPTTKSLELMQQPSPAPTLSSI